MGEAKSATDNALSMNDCPLDKLDLETRVGMLNADHRLTFDYAKEHLLHGKGHKDGTCQCDTKPLCMLVSGVGGTGKSYLIEVVSALLASIWPDHNLTCAITANTDLVSFIIHGVTVHHLFLLPVEHELIIAGYCSLSKDAQKTLKILLRYVKVFIVDEVSMLSILNLAY